MSEFKNDLHTLLNQFKIETEENAADFILAKYLTGCLDVFERVIIEILPVYFYPTLS
jgi:hypothetical protein